MPQGLIPALPLIAQLTALALKNAKAFSQKEETLKRLSLHAEALSNVDELSWQIAGNPDINQFFSNLVPALHPHFGFYRVTVALVKDGIVRGHVALKEDRVF